MRLAFEGMGSPMKLFEAGGADLYYASFPKRFIRLRSTVVLDAKKRRSREAGSVSPEREKGQKAQKSKGGMGGKSLIEPLYPVQNGQGCALSRHWDRFWGGAVQTKPHQARRHIVMVYFYKTALCKMREWAEQNQQVDRLAHLYRRCLMNYYQDQGDQLKQVMALTELDQLEAAVFYRSHNLKFTIYIGTSSGNGVANDVAVLLAQEEPSLLEKIDACEAKVEVIGHINDLIDRHLSGRKQFSNEAYNRERRALEADIVTVLTCAESDASLAALKQDAKERVISVYDSLVADMSSAGQKSLRQWQNSVLLPLQKQFMQLAVTPDCELFEKTLQQFLATDEQGAAAAGLDLHKLRCYEQYPDEVTRFVNAVSTQ